MPITKQRTLDYINLEWGSYVERFTRLPKAEQEKRLKTVGFESFRDMMAHILAWWEEGMTIIMAIAEGRESSARNMISTPSTRRRWRNTKVGMKPSSWLTLRKRVGKPRQASSL